MNPIKTRLLLPEYGRNVQEMVKYLKSIEDKEKRNEQARVVIGIMGNLYPYKRDTDEFRNMLWDHLFMIADFDIDIDSPFPQPTPELFQPKPATIAYSQKYISQKHYGGNFRTMVKKIVESDESSEVKNAAIANVAKFIRQQSYNYNREYPSNEVILADIQAACGSAYQIDMAMLGDSKIEALPTVQRNRNNNNNAKKLQLQRNNRNNRQK